MKNIAVVIVCWRRSSCRLNAIADENLAPFRQPKPILHAIYLWMLQFQLQFYIICGDGPRCWKSSIARGFRFFFISPAGLRAIFVYKRDFIMCWQSQNLICTFWVRALFHSRFHISKCCKCWSCRNENRMNEQMRQNERKQQQQQQPHLKLQSNWWK